MNNNTLSEPEVRNAVIKHFRHNRFRDFNVNTECDIQFGTGEGRNFGRADIVITDDKGHWIAIIECKSEKEGDTEKHRGQLRSYLSGTDTRFGILAFSDNPDQWIYCENQRANKFRIIRDNTYFEKHIFDPPTEVVLKQLYQRLKRITIAFIAALLIIATCLLIYFLILQPMHTNPQYEVARIIDGDTFEIQYKGKPTSVQLIGVNAPEPTELYSEEATMYLQEFLLDDLIYLRFDENKFDKHDRILGYVYRASDGIFVNLEVIREGYAEVDLRYPFKYKDLFMDYESRAKKDRKGLWGIIIEK